MAKGCQGCNQSSNRATKEKRMKTKIVKLADLTPDPTNANDGTEYGGRLLESSLRQDGGGRSLLVGNDMRVIAGNKTLQAAMDSGFEEAVVVETDGRRLVVVKRTDIEDSGSSQGVRMAIADNRIGEINLSWNMENLEFAMDVCDLSDFNFEELPQLDEVEPVGDPDAVPEAQEVTVSRTGDLWILGSHRVMCGDSTDAADVALLMDGELADSLITDPPYGVSYAEKNEVLNRLDGGSRKTTLIENDSMTISETGDFWKSVFSLAFEHTKKGGTYYMTGPQGGDLSMMMMMMMQEAGWLLKHVLIWVKNNHVLGRCDYNYKHEPILYGWKPGAGHYFGGSGSDTSVWSFDKPLASKLHPTMKPVELIAHAAERALKRGEIILDPFLGSGTSVIAAEQTGRRCYGLELSPAYVDVIVRRWQDYTGKTATLDDGRTFDEVEGLRMEANQASGDE